MKIFLGILVALFSMCLKAESWIELERSEGCISFIDRDSIKHNGDYAFYTTKDECDKKYVYIDKMKHDCKYRARQGLWRRSYAIGYPDYDKVIEKPTNMLRYDRNQRMAVIEEMVCRNVK